MTARYHVNDDGKVGECSAKKSCRFGSDKHGGTPEEARAIYEDSMKGYLHMSEQRQPSEVDLASEAEDIRLDRQDRARDAIAALNTTSEADYDEVAEIAIASVGSDLDGLDEETKGIVFGTAYDETVTSEDEDADNVSYAAVYNEFVELSAVVREVRVEGDFAVEHTSDEAKSVAASGNPLQSAFAVLRSKTLDPRVAQEVMESVYPLAVKNLSQDARDRIFQHGYQRYSENGYGDVLQDYGNVISLVQAVQE